MRKRICELEITEGLSYALVFSRFTGDGITSHSVTQIFPEEGDILDPDNRKALREFIDVAQQILDGPYEPVGISPTKPSVFVTRLTPEY